MGDVNTNAVQPSHDDIVSFISAELEKVNPDSISLNSDTDMTKDLNVDSLAVMDLMFAIEEHFDVSISLNDLADVKTIGDLAEMVQSQLTKG